VFWVLPKRSAKRCFSEPKRSTMVASWPYDTKEFQMSENDKDRIEGTSDKLAGNVKEGVGKLTGDKQTEAEGKADQLKGDVKQGVADVKDKASDIVDKKND
jgi:uncharacterized protein YjbJ (UPF0337 family)